MAKTIQEVIANLHTTPDQSLQQAMANFSHIELTQEEYDTAILQAKIKKDEALRYEERRKRAEENRKALTEVKWDTDRSLGYAQYRAQQIFDKQFIQDESNIAVVRLLAAYFSESLEFIEGALAMGIKEPSLKKGILLAGTMGTGKSWIMQLFAANRRQCFRIYGSRTIAETFHDDAEQALSDFDQPWENASNDASKFFQPLTGLCIDDIGSEPVQNRYGNKANVIGNLLEHRYSHGFTGPLLHATTNLTAAELREFYGERVASRMREIFNFVVLPGTDRRK